LILVGVLLQTPLGKLIQYSPGLARFKGILLLRGKQDGLGRGGKEREKGMGGRKGKARAKGEPEEGK